MWLCGRPENRDVRFSDSPKYYISHVHPGPSLQIVPWSTAKAGPCAQVQNRHCHMELRSLPTPLLVGVSAWLARSHSIPGGVSQRWGGQAPAFHVACCRDRSVGPRSAQSGRKVGPKLAQSRRKVGPKPAPSRPQVGPKSARSRPQVTPKSAPSWPQVGPRHLWDDGHHPTGVG